MSCIYNNPPPIDPVARSPLTEKQIKKYLKNPLVCPYCQSKEITDLDTYEITPIGTLLDQVRCESCGKEWHDVYTPTSIQEINV